MKNLKIFEEFIKSDKPSIDQSIKYLHKIPKEYKEIALGLLNGYTTAKNGKITGLQLHPELKKKIEDNSYPSGFDMGIDKDGYFIHTHRARSKSYESPSKIPVKDMKFINSTG